MVTPGLPPPLVASGESYLCHFRESCGVIEFTTDAIVLSPNMVYSCDVNGAVPGFSGIELGMIMFMNTVVTGALAN